MALPAAAALPASDWRRRVETSLGRVDIPASPQRVLAVDSRISLELALALDLPIAGYSHSRARPWVPVPDNVPMLTAPPDLEQILTLAPDLILCPDSSPNSDWWPLIRLSSIAPVLPSSHLHSWQVNLQDLGNWLGKTQLVQQRLSEHDRLILDIRNQHADTLSLQRFAALYYDTVKRRAMVCSQGTGYGLVMPAQVLSELGGQEIGADRLGPYGEVALECFGEVLGDVDAILLIDFGNGGANQLSAEPLWQRLPAVCAGHVHLINGNCVFGSLYTARYLAEGWRRLFARAQPQ
ncbi:putative siderophore-binding lipoprotein YfiY [Rhizobium rhizogenes]|uniref:Siderophore-binding lipoprotein YfiY n=2 Tax=Rhizobium/Agrobacterium group TaxID=227290 RepID=A0AAN2DGG7_RHIRH|nr:MULTISPECIES: ABC transporter substrate-binding protein [Rhizobium/Agrobacterium group]MCZ7445943.1 ABC transporter substrate-binding protein [Rhizobium rhizogenes]NSZ82365.1 ABC transporter substrate-binding protein [Agrobacterium tumefaciens]CAD0216663.1 putative siderophore-binding lipoprotein YfiY [Rhizobium rhizogenes]